MAKLKQTKTDLIGYVYENSSFDLKDISTCVNMFLDALKDSLGRGETVELRGFGTFEVKKRSGRRGFNFKTSEVVKNQDYHAVLFRPGKALKFKVLNTKVEENLEKDS